MTPEQIAKGGSEHAHQCALFAAIALNHPLNVAAHPLHELFAIKNQGHGDAIRGGQSKAEGVKAGVSDLFLPVPFHGFHGFFLELKTPDKATHKNGGLSAEQLEFFVKKAERGYWCGIGHGWNDALDKLYRYLAENRPPNNWR